MLQKAKLENLVSDTSPDVLFLCETKIDDTISNSEFIPPGYMGFRKDRNRDGGGLWLWWRTATKLLESLWKIL